MSARSFFTKEEQHNIVAAIKEAELNTSGEIRVHIENHCKEEALERAAEVFYDLKMDRTAARNGILFYLAVKDISSLSSATKASTKRWNMTSGTTSKTR